MRLILRRGGSSVIFFVVNTSGNSEIKSGVAELVMALNLMWLAFLQVRATPFLGKVIMAFPQSIIAL